MTTLNCCSDEYLHFNVVIHSCILKITNVYLLSHIKIDNWTCHVYIPIVECWYAYICMKTFVPLRLCTRAGDLSLVLSPSYVQDCIKTVWKYYYLMCMQAWLPLYLYASPGGPNICMQAWCFYTYMHATVYFGHGILYSCWFVIWLLARRVIKTVFFLSYKPLLVRD